MNLREQTQERLEQNILARLRDKGVPLDSPDAELKRAFVDTVSPTLCFRLACEMRERMRAHKQIQGRLL